MNKLIKNCGFLLLLTLFFINGHDSKSTPVKYTILKQKRRIQRYPVQQYTQLNHGEGRFFFIFKSLLGSTTTTTQAALSPPFTPPVVSPPDIPAPVSPPDPIPPPPTPDPIPPIPPIPPGIIPDPSGPDPDPPIDPPGPDPPGPDPPGPNPPGSVDPPVGPPEPPPPSDRADQRSIITKDDMNKSIDEWFDDNDNFIVQSSKSYVNNVHTKSPKFNTKQRSRIIRIRKKVKK